MWAFRVRWLVEGKARVQIFEEFVLQRVFHRKLSGYQKDTRWHQCRDRLLIIKSHNTVTMLPTPLVLPMPY